MPHQQQVALLEVLPILPLAMETLQNITKESPSSGQPNIRLLELLTILPMIIQEIKKDMEKHSSSEQPPPLLDGTQLFLLLKHAYERGEETVWTEQPDICEKEFGLSHNNTRCHQHKHLASVPIIGTAILGGILGTGMNWMFTKRSKDRLQMALRDLNWHSDKNKESILKNYNMINLTRIELGNHQQLLHKLDAMTIKLENTMDNLDTYLQGMVALVSAMDNINNKLDIIQSGIRTIRHDLLLLYQYMDTLTTGALTPTLVTPMDLYDILLAAEERIQGHPQLRLPADPKGPLWGYYKYMKVVTTIINEYLVILLQIPLVDISTSFDIY